MKKIILLASVVLFLFLILIMLLFNRTGVHFSADKTLHLTYGKDTSLPKVTAYYGGNLNPFFRHKLEVKQTGDVDFSKPGEYTILYSASYEGKDGQFEQTVYFEDKEDPVITLVNDENHFTSPGCPYVEEGYSATDNCDGDITDKVVVEEKDGIVTYTVSDSSGNKTSVTREIVYKDVVAPVIALEGQETMTVAIGAEFSDPGYSATDDVDGDVTKNVKVSGSVDTSTAGDYTITYEVTDSSDNTAKVERLVTVKESDPTNKVVYLTFDDGPGPYTSKLLDVLDKYNVKATFFVTNTCPDYVDMIKEEADRGHTVAIHTYCHDYPTIYQSVEAYKEDMDKMNEIIYAQTGSYANIFRFPGGSSNTVSKKYCSGIMTELTQKSAEWGMTYYDWNVDSDDAGSARSSDVVYQNVISGIKSCNVSVVLQHDIKSYSVDAVERIIQWGLDNGYTFLPLSDSSKPVHHGVNN